jgi:hypothetical protein
MSFVPKIKKAKRKAIARRSGKTIASAIDRLNAKLTKPHQFPVHENNQLHKTSAAIAEDARRQERLMDRKRWSHAG